MDDWFERSPFIGFLPWLIYWVVADGLQHVDVRCGVRGDRDTDHGRVRRLRRVRLLDVVTVVFFTGVTVAGLLLGHQDGDWMDTYATTLSSGCWP